ncbi:MAG: protease inhibitor I42 family protein [Elusimicrobia bacterium]|nr:protease inhibitor I42 family protein [Elusimicrobiota bacterium]
MKKSILLSLIFLGFVLTSFSASKSQKTSDAHRITVKPGQTFQIKLQANPTTGYTWQMQNPIDKSFLTVLNKTFTAKSKSAGNPGNEVWQFKALKKGTIFITFAYRRSWESEVQKKESYAVYIK